MRIPVAVYDKKSSQLFFRCPRDAVRFNFRAGIEPKEGVVISSRCPVCGCVFPSKIRHGTPERTQEKEDK